jgi:hypothetical protein
MMRLHSVVAVVALSLSAAGSDGARSRWFSFAEYPQARLLCHEHVLGHGPRRMEIEWQSFAVAESSEKVAAFFEQDQKARAEKDEHSGYTLTAPADPRDKMSIFPSSQAAHHPSCAIKARSSERTVIMVSRMVGG